ncbi:hypothetical protein, partial [Pseudoalteromonas sp.]|uniref:hypothetical protein n=1 Tax=Pseudoalteromonas sp. TaxID=53249 RepID=UPI00261FE69E
MDCVEQLKQKVSRLLQQFAPGQIEPSTESLEAYQLTREKFREGLLLLQGDENGKKQQEEAQVLADALDKEQAKDKMGVSLEEDARKEALKAGTGQAEDVAPDQCTETT